jgi:hypothetical protein
MTFNLRPSNEKGTDKAFLGLSTITSNVGPMSKYFPFLSLSLSLSLYFYSFTQAPFPLLFTVTAKRVALPVCSDNMSDSHSRTLVNKQLVPCSNLCQTRRLPSQRSRLSLSLLLKKRTPEVDYQSRNYLSTVSV